MSESKNTKHSAIVLGATASGEKSCNCSGAKDQECLECDLARGLEITAGLALLDKAKVFGPKTSVFSTEEEARRVLESTLFLHLLVHQWCYVNDELPSPGLEEYESINAEVVLSVLEQKYSFRIRLGRVHQVTSQELYWRDDPALADGSYDDDFLFCIVPIRGQKRGKEVWHLHHQLDMPRWFDAVQGVIKERMETIPMVKAALKYFSYLEEKRYQNRRQ